MIITGSCAGVSLVGVIVPTGAGGGRLDVSLLLTVSVAGGCCAAEAIEENIITMMISFFIQLVIKADPKFSKWQDTMLVKIRARCLKRAR